MTIGLRAAGPPPPRLLRGNPVRFVHLTNARTGRALSLTSVMTVALLALASLPISAAAHAPLNARPTSITAYPDTTSRTTTRETPGDPAVTPGLSGNGNQSRMEAQHALGEPRAATVELLAGERTGYLFNSSGEQIATKSVTFKAAEADSASRRLRKGNATYRLLTWGPLAGYWVRLNASIRLVPPTSWKVLVLVYRQTSLDFVGAGGETRHLEATMSPSMEALVLKTVPTPSLVANWSSGVAAQRQTVVYPPRPLTSLSPLGDGAYWVGPGDVAADLDVYAPPGTYDSVLVLWQPWDADDHVPSWGWGLGLSAGPPSNGAAYATITVPPSDRSSWITTMPFPGEVYLHEWLHGVIDYHHAHGAQVPDLHNTGYFGYSSDDNSWRSWYSDLMQRHVPDPHGGAAVGIDYRVWQAGTPRQQP